MSRSRGDNLGKYVVRLFLSHFWTNFCETWLVYRQYLVHQPYEFSGPSPNVMVTVRQNNSSTVNILLFIATISQDQFNPCPWMFRPRIQLMGHTRPQFRAKANFPVGFPYRFNSSHVSYLLIMLILMKSK